MRTAFLRSRADSIADRLHDALDTAFLVAGIAVALAVLWISREDDPYFWE